MSSSNMIVLKSSDGETFELDEAVAVQSQTIKHMIEDGCASTAIPLLNVTGKILAKVVEYLNHHASVSEASDDLKDFDANFVNVDQVELFDLILAANYLDVRSLLALTCQTVADSMKGKTVDQIRRMFNITNDFTPEEEEELRRENNWAFD